MAQNRLKTISDATLADTILKMRDDYGYWDQDPAVFCYTRNAFNALGNKMTRGVSEVVKRVDNGGGILKHPSLKKIYDKVSKLNAGDRRDSHEVYEALRDVKRKPEPKKPRYAF